MSIKTKSAFIYGHKIQYTNYALDFSEGAGTIQANLPIGDYGLSELAEIVQETMNAEGGQAYTVTVDRAQRKFTISAAGNFELKISSGRGISCYSLLGFTGLDKTGGNSYVSDVESGFLWLPQSVAEEYVPKEHNLESIDESINESGSGVLEVLTFGNRQFIDANFKYVTDLPQSSASPFDNDSQGIAKAIQFLTYAATKAKFEFIPDRSDFNTYDEVLLESIEGSRAGTGFKLKKLFGEAGQAYYETGRLNMRVL